MSSSREGLQSPRSVLTLRAARQLVLAMLPISVLAPSLRMGQFEISPAYVLIVLVLPFCILALRWPTRLWGLALLLAALLVEVAVSSLIGPVTFRVAGGLPLDVIQYLELSAAFVIWFTACYKKWADARFVVHVFLWTGVVGLTIGVLQWAPVQWNRALWELYSYSQYQLTNYEAPLPLRRVPGVAHHATSNGGFAAAFFVLALTLLLYVTRLRTLCLTIAALAFVNAIASQARMGYLTMVFGGFVVYALAVHANPHRAPRYTLWLFLCVAIAAAAIFALLSTQNALVLQALYRWQVLAEQIEAGGNRLEQIDQGLALLDGVYPLLLGVSRDVQQSISDFYVEVEPLNVLVLYGGVGVVLHYGLVAFLVVYLARGIGSSPRGYESGLVAGAFVVLVCYQFFSLAYYFFRDTFVGVLPWMLIGAAVGSVERTRSESMLPVHAQASL